METQSDVLRNPDSFMQLGDMVAFSFTLASLALFVIAAFILIQLKSVPKTWKLPILLGTVVALTSAIMAFIRRDYWIATMTDPVEFRFIDWIITVPLMATAFYYMLKPLGASRWMAVRLYLAGFWMIAWGYIGESVYPENSFYWGLIGSLGFAAIIAMIIAEGYPKIFRQPVNPKFKKGYVALSLFLPLSWMIYPIGYMTVPGNIWEGGLGVDTVAVLYNLADIMSKGGLALGIAFIASKTGDEILPAEDFSPAIPEKQLLESHSTEESSTREITPRRKPPHRSRPRTNYHS